MNKLINAFLAELIKVKNSKIFLITFIAFALAPIMGGVFMIILNNPSALDNASLLKAKSQAMNFSKDWDSYFNILIQSIGVGGVLVFGFVASWIFGREYSDGTAKDLLSLPTSRTQILNSKFILYFFWCLLLALSNLIIAIFISIVIGLQSIEIINLLSHLKIYFITLILTISIGTPIAFFSILGKGYLPPLGFVALTLVFSQIIAATGYGYYFPWSIPGLYSGAGGEYKEQLNAISYFILFTTGFAGYITTLIYWNTFDQIE